MKSFTPRHYLENCIRAFVSRLRAMASFGCGCFLWFAWAGFSPWSLQGATTTQISQFGITWNFSQPVEYGQFVNGDYWVVGPVTVSSVSPAPSVAPSNEVNDLGTNNWGDTGLQDNTSRRNGSMVVMAPSSAQGYDSRGRGYQSSASITFPYTLQTNRSLISSKSRLTIPSQQMHHAIMWSSEKNGKQVMQTAAVLTCLASAPPADAFRPTYIGGTKTIYTLSQIQWGLLRNLDVPVQPLWSQWERYLERPWLDHMNGHWFEQWLLPIENMPSYGREYARIVGQISLMLQLNVPQAQKETLLIRLVQLGIDLRGVALVGGGWNEGGGVSSGRKWPVVFAGLMLNQPSFYQDTSTIFHEDTQTYWGSGWAGQSALWQMVVHHGIRQPFMHLHPSQYASWDSGWGTASETYRKCCTAKAWAGQALAALLMGAKSAWNHDAFFGVEDDWMRQTDLYAAGRGGLARPSEEGQSFESLVDDMWLLHRDTSVPAQANGTLNRMWDANQWQWVSNPPPGGGGGDPSPIVALTASSYQAPNVPENTIDGNLGTRWSAEGVGEWVEYELDDVYSIQSVNVAFTNGTSRYDYFDIDISLDGVNWTTVYSGQSSGTTIDLEAFDFTDTNGQYLRYVGGGNSQSLWNSVSEVEIELAESATDTEAPSTPTGLAASNVTMTTVDLDWNASTDNTGVTGYKIYTGGSNPADVGLTTAVTLTDLSPGTGYTFTVSAYDAATNESNQSSGVNVTTLSGGGALISETFASSAANFTEVAGGTWAVSGGEYVLSNPSTSSPVPGNGNISVHNTSLTGDWTLTVDASVTATVSDWNDVSILFGYQDDENYYFVSLSESNDGSTSGIFLVENGVGGQISDISELISADTAYAIEIVKSASAYVVKRNGLTIASMSDSTFTDGQIGLGSRNDGAIFDNLEVIAAGGGSDTTAPSAPTGLQASSITATTANLSWGASSDNVGVVGYYIYTNGSNPVSAMGTSLVVTGLTQNTSYTFTVSAYDAASNESDESSEVNMITADGEAPSVPDGLSASNISTTSVDLSWNASTDNVGVAGYTVYTNGASPVSATGTSVTISGLTQNTAYTFTVSSHDAAGNTSDPSSGANVTTADGEAPSVPIGLTHSNLTSTTVDLSWSASTDNVGVAGYYLYTNGSNPISVGTNSYTITGLTASTSYTFTVSAYDAASNESGESSGVNVTTASSALISEDFSSGAGNFTVVLGGTWSVSSGAYVLTNPGSSGNSGNGNISVHHTGLSGDWALSVDASVTATASDWNDFSILFGYQDQNNYYFVSFNESNDGATSGIFEVASGAMTQLADITSLITAGTTYNVEIIKSGSSYMVKLEGSTVASMVDSTYSAGKVGFGSRNDGGTFDSLIVIP